MGAFIIRRTLGAVLVLIAVSFLTFCIFIVIPGGDPAERMAGKNATDENIANIRETWGFDQPFYVAVRDDDEEGLHRRPDLLHDAAGRDRRDQARPACDDLAGGRRRDHLALLRRARGGDLSRDGGEAVGPRHHGPRADRDLHARVLARDPRALLPRPGEPRDLPGRRLRPADREPGPVALPHDPAVVRARRALHRVLRTRAALEHPRLDQRGLRAHREGEGIEPAPRDVQARPPELDDPDRHALRARLRRRDRRWARS